MDIIDNYYFRVKDSSTGGGGEPTVSRLYVHHLRLWYHGFNESDESVDYIPGSTQFAFDFITTKKDKYTDLAAATKDIWESTIEKSEDKLMATVAVAISGSGYCEQNDNHCPAFLHSALIRQTGDKLYWILRGVLFTQRYEAFDITFEAVEKPGDNIGRSDAWGIQDEGIQEIILGGASEDGESGE